MSHRTNRAELADLIAKWDGQVKRIPQGERALSDEFLELKAGFYRQTPEEWVEDDDQRLSRFYGSSQHDDYSEDSFP